MADATLPRRRTERFADVRHRVLPPLIALAVILLIWEVVVRTAGMDPTLFVPPSAIVAHIPEVVGTELYGESLLKTLRLLGIGFGISAVLGVTIGVALGRARLLDRALSPWVMAVYAAPIPAIIPLLTAAVGFALTAKVLVVVLLGVFPILINTKQGVLEVQEELYEVASSFQCNPRQVMRFVVLPSALPFILVGLRLGAVRSLIGTVVAEFYTSPGGLGYMIVVFARRFDNASMFTPVLTLTILGLSLVGVVRLLERRLTHWKADR